MDNYLKHTKYIDFDHPVFVEFINQHTLTTDTKKEKTIKLYYAIRDGWRYNPYQIFLDKNKWIASEMFQRPDGHCIDKAVIMIACLRALNIPARLHLGKVKNHIGVEGIVAKIGTDELSPHGYLEAFLDDKWVKITPAFNKALCDRLNVDTLEFDGENDSLFQSFDKEGGQFMEYLADYGTFEDVPMDFIFQNMKEHYGKFFKTKMPSIN